MVYTNPDGRGDPNTLKPAMDFWVQTGVVAQAADPNSLVDFSTVDAAVRGPGKYQEKYS